MDRVYFSLVHDYPKNVITSQVVEYFEMLEKFGVHFNIIFMIRLGSYIKGFRELSLHRSNIQSRIPGKVSFFPVGRNYISLSVYFATFILLLRFLKYRNKKQIVIHARGYFSAFIASKLKRFYKNLNFVYDVRGDVTEEYKYHAIKQNVPPEKIEEVEKGDLLIQKVTTGKAGWIFCVSNVLKLRMIEKYGTNEKKIDVIPCLADHEYFYYDSAARNNMRRKFNLENKFVFVYPGGIGYWHYSDKVFEIIGELMNRRDDVYFIILTPNEKEALEMAKQYLKDDRYLIKHADRREVPGYLLASDMGILLREKHPLNEVAAPTKFAEYVMTGLNVLISENIGDYSNFVAKHEIGIVLSNSPEVNEYIPKFEKYFNEGNKKSHEEISKLGYENFAKIKYSKIMRDVYTSI